jgi:exosome complex component RRP4
MFSVSSRQPLAAMAITDDLPSSSTHRRHADEVEDMDVDDIIGDDSAEAGFSGEGIGRSIVGPGEGITSSKEYMRYVSLDLGGRV